MTLGESLEEASLLTGCGTPKNLYRLRNAQHLQEAGTHLRCWDHLCACVFFFNSPTKCNSFGNIPHRAFKTRFPPVLHAVTGLCVYLDNAASAFLLYDPEKNLHYWMPRYAHIYTHCICVYIYTHTVGSIFSRISEHAPWSTWATPTKPKGREQSGPRNSAPTWRVKWLYRDWENEFTFFLFPCSLLLLIHANEEREDTDTHKHVTSTNISHNIHICRPVMLPLIPPIMCLST